MPTPYRRTKIVATIGPASSSKEMIREMILAGMNVARLNFSHGKYEDHAVVVLNLRTVSGELGIPVTIMQDLQGPKIRVGQLPGGAIDLVAGETVSIVPEAEFTGQPGVIPIDYPHVADEAKVGMTVLLADGLFELEILGVEGHAVRCKVIEGGKLQSRKGVNFPNLVLRLPSLTDKDIRDLEFGLTQDIDWVSLSFVRTAADIRTLKDLLAKKGMPKPVIAKIEKPQAVEHLAEILEESNGIMVARGDLGVEMSPEKVPLIQKEIISLCNRKGIPVITATQMLESMIHEPRPTRAEASDVANAIIDGTDAVMLSGESAVGEFPVKAIEMMAKIATEVESKIEFRSYPPDGTTEIYALSEAANVIGKTMELACIVVMTTSGRSARFVAAERPRTPVFALTRNPKVYHGLNLLWGITPILDPAEHGSYGDLVSHAEATVKRIGAARPGDKILILAGVPAYEPGGTNFLKIHTVG
jgi:pyruvate kinase